MRLLDYTTEMALLPNQEEPDLGAVIKRLAGAMAGGGLIGDPAILVRDVLHREAEAGTGLIEGLVLPHALSQAADRVQMAVATLRRPVAARDSDGADLEVDVVVLLTAPPGESRQMLRVLARLAREIRAGLAERLRQADTVEAMVRLLSGISSDPL